ncbi:NAD(P)-dependent oxidoreductase [Qipengyuania sp. 6B39]|uniref:NAD-dependent epimerase/dehydratase family protein n=1 Tax=Qipengyuania proteolytica TaxID=2867239 RepID=UPI001C8AC387|nr:NAD(P)-dependent oxidoreductase [Qipengyuania proteolytica]MBX7495799.1 NAD(P)-dependent oxidoreductase [Qipengyuania proteolytica]
MKGARCLVTGAAGFIGSHLCRRLANAGAEVHALVRPGGSRIRIVGLADRVTMHSADLEDGAAMALVIEAARPELVFHLATPTRGGIAPSIDAAQDSIDRILTPLLSFVSALADRAEPPAHFIRAGTIAEYGNSALPFREDRREAPSTPYGAAMLAGTQHLAMLQNTLPFPTVTARLALTYGPEQDKRFMIPAMLDACQRGEAFKLQRPDDRRDLIHVDDVVGVLLELAERPRAGATHVNIGTGYAPSMREVGEHMVEITGCRPDLITSATDAAPDSPSELRCDNTLAKRLYGWEATIPLHDGLRMLALENRTTLAAAGERHG